MIANNCRVDNNNTQYYGYSVISGFHSMLILSLFTFATLIAVVVYKRKKFHAP
jgi:hypothetical protein